MSTLIRYIGEADAIEPGVSLYVSEREGRAWIGVYVKLEDPKAPVECVRVGIYADHGVSFRHMQITRAGAEETRCDLTHALETSRTAHDARAVARAYWWPYSEAWI